MTVEFECSTFMDVPRERVFELSLRSDIHLQSMRRYRERLVRGPASGVLVAGDEVRWRAMHFGLPWWMTTRITEYAAPGWFVDEQVRGPFAFFRHEHRFEDEQGGTRMSDHVIFAAPFGVLGRLVERVLLRQRMRQLIEQRNSFLAEAVMRTD